MFLNRQIHLKPVANCVKYKLIKLKQSNFERNAKTTFRSLECIMLSQMRVTLGKIVSLNLIALLDRKTFHYQGSHLYSISLMFSLFAIT